MYIFQEEFVMFVLERSASRRESSIVSDERIKKSLEEMFSLSLYYRIILVRSRCLFSLLTFICS